MKLSLVLALLVLSFNSFAACEVTITRTACPGKEEKALEPYLTDATLKKISASEHSTTETVKKATSAEACTKEGEKLAKIVRTGTLSKKATKATFDGKDVGEKSDSKGC